jgi:tellurite resistance protein
MEMTAPADEMKQTGARRRWFDLSASLFGMVLGLGGLANAWRAAARLWGWPGATGDVLAVLAISVWAILAVIHIGRWLLLPQTALAELRHPVRSSFVALAPISTAVASTALAPFAHTPAAWLMILGVVGQMAFGVTTMAGFMRGERATADTTPGLYVPIVGGFLVSAIAASAFGYRDSAVLLFGAGLLSWLTLESVILSRLLSGSALAVELRATMGLYFTPPGVACVAYLAITDGPPDIFAQGLFGYALLHAAAALWLAPWLLKQKFSTPYWAYTFGLSALPMAALRLAERGQTGPAAVLALPLLCASTLAIGAILIGTLVLLARHLLGRPAANAA